MKKILTLAFAILCSTICLMAAKKFDLIIKTNSEKIEALIQEVGDTEVKYKKANNPKGPMFVIKLADISSIVYANGDVQAIAHNGEAQPQAVSQPKGGEDRKASQQEALTRDGNTYFYKGKPMGQKEFVEFIKADCDIAYQHYLKNRKMERTGWALFGVGLGVCAVGGTLLQLMSDGQKGDAETAMIYASYAAYAMGAGMVAAGIPLICVGNIKKKNSHEVYNMHCDQPQAFQPELKLTSGPNGLGLALSF